MKRFEKMWYKTKYLIRAENNKSDDYDYKYMKLKNKY